MRMGLKGDRIGQHMLLHLFPDLSNPLARNRGEDEDRTARGSDRIRQHLLFYPLPHLSNPLHKNSG